MGGVETRIYEVKFVESSFAYKDDQKPVRFDLWGPEDIRAGRTKIGNVKRADGSMVQLVFVGVSYRRHKNGWKTLKLRNLRFGRGHPPKKKYTMTVRLKELC